MSPALTAALIGIGWALAVTLFLSLCVAAARGDRLARRMLGPASSDEQRDLGLLLSMDDSRVPARRRHEG